MCGLILVLAVSVYLLESARAIQKSYLIRRVSPPVVRQLIYVPGPPVMLPQIVVSQPVLEETNPVVELEKIQEVEPQPQPEAKTLPWWKQPGAVDFLYLNPSSDITKNNDSPKEP